MHKRVKELIEEPLKSLNIKLDDVEYVKEHNVSGFKFLKCGKFDIKNKRESEKTDEKMVLASPNQKLYDENYNLISKDGIYYFN